MQKETVADISLAGLFRMLREEVAALFRQEINLAKTELSEKATRLSRNGVWLVAGGFVLYAGLLVFVIGLGLLIAFGLERAGINRTLACFAGLAIVGLSVSSIGGALMAKALKTLKQESVKPEKTLHTLRELSGTPAETAVAAEPVRPTERPTTTSDQIQARIEVTRDLMRQTANAIGERLSPKWVRFQMVKQILDHPVASALLGTGLASLIMQFRKRHVH